MKDRYLIESSIIEELDKALETYANDPTKGISDVVYWAEELLADMERI